MQRATRSGLPGEIEAHQGIVEHRKVRHSIREDAHRAEEDENEEEDKVARARLQQRKRALSEGEDNEHVQRRDDPENDIVHKPRLPEDIQGQRRIIPEGIVSRCIGLVDQKPDHELEQSADDHCDHEELEHSTPHGLSLFKYMDLQWQ